MEDSFGRVVAIVLSVFALFYLPILSISLKQDNITQASIDIAVVEFVDRSRVSGKITAEEYERLCNTVDTLQSGCEIQIEHSSRMAINTNGMNDIFFSDFNKEDVLETIYGGTKVSNYKLRNGDFLKVTVKNVVPTMSTRLYRLIMPFYNPSGMSIYSVYGGMVGNNVE